MQQVFSLQESVYCWYKSAQSNSVNWIYQVLNVLPEFTKQQMGLEEYLHLVLQGSYCYVKMEYQLDVLQLEFVSSFWKQQQQQQQQQSL